MTQIADLLPMSPPHNGKCECSDHWDNFWCNHCATRMAERVGSDRIVFINRERPEPPLFLSAEEALHVAEGVRLFGEQALKLRAKEDRKKRSDAFAQETHDEWRKLNAE